MDQSSFAAPHGLSQRITSFIACACQGIHQMPLEHLIVLIANAHHLFGSGRPCPDGFAAGVPSLTIRATLRLPNRQLQRSDYLLQSDHVMMPSTCSAAKLYPNHAEQFACLLPLRPASRDLSGSARSGNAHRHARQRCSGTPKPQDPERSGASAAQTTNNEHA